MYPSAEQIVDTYLEMDGRTEGQTGAGPERHTGPGRPQRNHGWL